MPYTQKQMNLFQCVKHGGCKGSGIKPGQAAKMVTHGVKKKRGAGARAITGKKG